MAPDTVFLLTNVYPFAKGEEFIETEIQHLAAAFERVVIVTCQPPVDAEQTRRVPENCTVLRAGSPRPGGRRAATMVGRRLPQVLGRGPVHPGKVAAEGLFEARAQDTMRLLRPQLDAVLPGVSEAVIYSYWFHVTARAGMLLADELRGRGITVTKLVSRAHRYDLYPEESPFNHLPARRLLLQAYDEVHPVSDHGTRLLRTSFPRFAPKVTTRRLGTTDPGARVDCRQEPARIVSCSFVLPVKRVNRFAGVVARVRELGTDLGWTHFGSGDLLDEVSAETEAAVPGAADFRGYVPNKQLPDHYRQLRPMAFVNLSESEGVPVAIMEAIALGMPVVATDVGGVAEIVHDGVNGHLLPGDFTDEQAAHAIHHLASCPPEEYARYCADARRRWEETFNQAVVYPDFARELAQPPRTSMRPRD